MKNLLPLLLFTTIFGYSQPKSYSIANAHSHNDYEQKRPFLAAYELHFGSIEADLYLKDGDLYVSHNEKDIKPERTFHQLYLNPLLAKIEENHGSPYPNKQPVQLLLDLKKEGRQIMQELEKQLSSHKKALKNVKIVISGDMPSPEEFVHYDKIFNFDGRNNLIYSEKAYKRVAFVSASFTDFGKYWPGKEPLADETFQKIKIFVEETHAKGKGVRLWGTPNTALGFKTLTTLGVDWIGSDDLPALADFLAAH